MSQSQVSNKSGKTYGPLAGEHLIRTQTKLVPLLNNPEYLSRLKIIVGKYETLDSSDVQNFLYSKIHRFKPATQHKIRDFINRVEKRQNENNNSEKSFQYNGSDTSNFVSPSSRESFSSRSETDNYNCSNDLQADVQRLWKFPVCQREICELLYENGDLEVCSTRKVAVDFNSLKSSSVRALTDYISVKSALIEEIRKDRDLYVLFQILSSVTFDNDTTNKICDILLQSEKITPNPSGIRSIEITLLKPSTKTLLMKLLQPHIKSLKIDDVISTDKKTNSSCDISPMLSEKSSGSLSSAKPLKVEKDATESYGPFAKEQLRFILSGINEKMKNEGIADVMKIINAHETNTGMSNLNIKKLKEVTKHYLYKYFTEIANNGGISS